MFEKVKLKIAIAEVFPNFMRVTEHAEIAIANLRHTAVNASLEHVAGDDRRLHGLERFMTQHPGLPIQTDVRDVGDAYACLIKAVLHCLVGEPAVMFTSRKPLFLGSSYDFTILY